MIRQIRSFEDLEVWQLGHRLAVMIYEFTEGFPEHEMYGLTSQIRRAAVSIPGNIAEGFGRYHYRDRVKFFLNSRGSLNELKSHLLIADELGFLDQRNSQPTFELIEAVSVKLNNLITATRRSQRGDSSQ